MAIVFHYRGYTASGEKTAGSTKADTADLAREDLRRRGVIPTEILADGGVGSILRGQISLPGRMRESQMLFFRTFAILARSGKNTDEALGVVARRSTNPAFRESLEAVRAEMNTGASLSEAMSTRPGAFTPLQTAIVKVGEKAGAVDEVLSRVADFLEAEQATQRRIQGALAYPVIVITAALGLVAFMFTTIIPSFASFFQAYDLELPWVTKVILVISGIMTQPVTWLGIVGTSGLLLALFFRSQRTKSGRIAADRVRLRLPIVGRIINKSIASRASRLLALLLQSGVDIDEGLDILIPVTGSPVFGEGLTMVREDLKAGAGFVAAVEASGLFDSIFISLLESGQEIGAVDQMLIKAADYYDEDVASALSVLSASLQPILLTFLGLVVALIAVGVYLPLYQLVSNVR